LIEKKDVNRVKEVIDEFIKDLEKLPAYLRKQEKSFNALIEKCLKTKFLGNYLCFINYGRLFRLAQLFAARMFQIRGIKLQFIGEPIVADVEKGDFPIISSMGGQFEQVIENIKDLVEERNILPFVITGEGESELLKLVLEKDLPNLIIPGNVRRPKELISWFDRQFEEIEAVPLENSSEIVLLALYEAIVACILEKLGMTEKDLIHIRRMEYPAGLKEPYQKPTQEQKEIFYNYYLNNSLKRFNLAIVPKELVVLVDRTETGKLADIVTVSQKIAILESLASRAPPSDSEKSQIFQALINDIILHETSHLIKGLNEEEAQLESLNYFKIYPQELIKYWVGSEIYEVKLDEDYYLLLSKSLDFICSSFFDIILHWFEYEPQEIYKILDIFKK